MSEYQAYQFDRINRTLSASERKQISKLSSHISVSGSSAYVEYHYGDFKHDPLKVLEKYFDMVTYYANWGSQMIAFRFDEAAVDFATLSTFADDEIITISKKNGSILLVTCFDENYTEDFYGSFYDEDETLGASFTAFYNEILEGDYRALFLLWLKACEMRYTDESLDPLSLPPGMAKLHQAHEDLIAFIELDSDLIRATAEASPPLAKANNASFKPEKLLHLIDDKTQKEYLARLLKEDPVSVRSEIIQHLRHLNPKRKKPQKSTIVTYAELKTKTEATKNERKRREEEKLNARRQTCLRELKQHAPRMWEKVPELIERKKTKDYDLAVSILQALKFLATEEDRILEFYNQSNAIVKRYPTLKGMRYRMEDAEVISDDLTKTDASKTAQNSRKLKDNLPDQEFAFHLLDT